MQKAEFPMLKAEIMIELMKKNAKTDGKQGWHMKLNLGVRAQASQIPITPNLEFLMCRSCW